jgi:hypothetical protein
VSGLAPFTLTVSGVSVGTSGVLLDLDDDGPGKPWHELSQRVTQAIARVCGPESVTYDPGAPHISLTYCRLIRGSDSCVMCVNSVVLDSTATTFLTELSGVAQ